MNRAETLDAARHAVLQSRAAIYSPPENTFGLIADLWSALLGQDVTPAQVCLMLAVLKVARGWDNPGHADNWVDLAGYAACGAEVAGLDGAPPPAAHARAPVDGANVVIRGNGEVLTMDAWAALAERCDLSLREALSKAAGELKPYTPGPRGRVPVADPAEPAAGTEGGKQAAETAPAPEAVPTPAPQDRQGPPPSEPTEPDPPRWGKPGPVRERSKVDGLWRGSFTDAERAAVIAGTVKGHSAAKIAQALERPAENIRVLIATTLKAQIAAAKAEAANAGAGNAPVLPDPAPAVGPAEAEGPAPSEPAPAQDVSATEAARRIGKALRDADALAHWQINGLPEWLALIEAARPSQHWSLSDDREMLRLISLRWPMGDIGAEIGKSVPSMKIRKEQLTCAGKWPLAEVAAVLGVQA